MPIKSSRAARVGLLTSTAVFGLAAVMLTTGVPSKIQSAYADAVRVQAPAEPGFADVVEAVTPAVVSVRVKTEARPVSSQFFSGPEELPEDSPMRRFFDQFGKQDPFGFGDRFGQRGDQGNRPRKMPRMNPLHRGPAFFISEDGYVVTNNYIVSEDGYVVTNNYIVDNGQEFTVILNDGTQLDAELVGKDARTDLAVLKVDADREFTHVAFDKKDDTRIGD